MQNNVFLQTDQKLHRHDQISGWQLFEVLSRCCLRIMTPGFTKDSRDLNQHDAVLRMQRSLAKFMFK